MLELRKLEYKDKESLIRYLQYWYDNNEKIVPSNVDVAHYQYFQQMVEQLHHPPVNMNTVPSTTLFYFKNDDIVGAVNIRHELNDKLKNIGGHVGYGVAKPYRGNGYASSMLEEALNRLNKMGIHKVLMTCNPYNYASQKVIKKHGGYEINSYIKKNGQPVSRFEIPNDGR